MNSEYEVIRNTIITLQNCENNLTDKMYYRQVLADYLIALNAVDQAKLDYELALTKVRDIDADTIFSW